VRLLSVLATEGDIPPASSLAFPEGTAISEDMRCASGGCWSIFTVRPDEESTPSQLASYLETTFSGHVMGSFWDPRTINFKTEVNANSVVVTASYWNTYDR
jgi:hypothetical protein